MLATVMQIVVVSMVCGVLLTEASNDRAVSRGQRPEVRGQAALGGWNKMNVTDSEVLAVATEAAAHLETIRNTGKVYQLQDVVSAKYQVVRGINYFLSLRIGETDCIREPNADLEDCTIVKIERCVVLVLVWQDSSDFINFTCRAQRPPLRGGVRKIDVDSEEVQEVAAFAATELTSRSNGLYQVQHRCISRATSQLVAGLLYQVTMDVSVTSNNKSETTRCNVKVWDQAWRTPRFTLEEYKCKRLIS